MIAALCLIWALAPSPDERGSPPVASAPASLPDEIGRDELLELLRRHSPAIAAARGEIDVARAEQVQARLWPNPELRYIGYGRSAGTPAAINGQQHQIELAMPLLIAGQVPARRRAAASRTRAAEASVCVSASASAGEALRGFVGLLAAQERLAILEAGDRSLAAAEELTTARASVGAQSQYDALRVATEREMFAMGYADVRSAAVEASTRLADAVGVPHWRPRAIGSLEPHEDAAPSAAPPWATHGKYLPALEWARRSREVAYRERRVAARERWPIPTVSLGAYVTTDGNSSSIVASLGVPLPIFDRGQGALARARAVERAASLRETAIERAAATELGRAHEVLAVRRDAARAFRRSALTRGPQLREMAQEAYRGGAGTVLELLDAERAWLDVQLRWIDLLERLAIAELDVDVASGALARRLCRPTDP